MNRIAHERSHAPPQILLVVLGAVLLFSSCGGAPMRGVESVDDRRREVDALWAPIQDMEKRAGIDPDASVPVTVESTASDIDVSTRSMTPAPTTTAGSSSPARERTTCHENDGAADGTCTDVCELARAICVNATSICRIANELADEDWANKKCTGATTSCTRADQRCCQCSS